MGHAVTTVRSALNLINIEETGPGVNRGGLNHLVTAAVSWVAERRDAVFPVAAAAAGWLLLFFVLLVAPPREEGGTRRHRERSRPR